MPTERPTCATCPYWRLTDDSEEEIDRTESDFDSHIWTGECRRNAPIVNVEINGSALTIAVFDRIANVIWAPTCSDEWCGEHPDFPGYLASLRDANAEAVMAADWNPPDESSPPDGALIFPSKMATREEVLERYNLKEEFLDKSGVGPAPPKPATIGDYLDGDKVDYNPPCDKVIEAIDTRTVEEILVQDYGYKDVNALSPVQIKEFLRSRDGRAGPAPERPPFMAGEQEEAFPEHWPDRSYWPKAPQEEP